MEVEIRTVQNYGIVSILTLNSIKMKKLLSLFVLFGACAFSFGQSQSDKVDILWGAELKHRAVKRWKRLLVQVRIIFMPSKQKPKCLAVPILRLKNLITMLTLYNQKN